MIAAICIRSGINAKKDKRDTLSMLKIDKPNRMSIVSDDLLPMIKKVRDYTTWGKVSDETVKKLGIKEGRGVVFTKGLGPPKKGYRSTKRTYPKGSLGDRGDKINQLIERML